MKTPKQQFLSAIYPFIKWSAKLVGTHSTVLYNKKNIKPVSSIYNHFVGIINGDLLMLQEWKGKKILIVNTASDCGYTAQYKELEKLHQQYGQLIKIIAFPSNDFGEQEKGSDHEIIQFCQDNFGVSFPVAKKSTVIKSGDQHPVFHWLTSKDKNGWNDQAPKWNFCKFLINEEGMLTHYFEPTISPMSKHILDAIKQ
jgi:glutathione peroxidase